MDFENVIRVNMPRWNWSKKFYRTVVIKNSTFPIYMDLSKVFDSLNHSIFINKLSHYGIHGNELSWFSSYLCNRIQYVEIEYHQSGTLYLQTGVPQGSILGPLLFLLYMNDAPNIGTLLEFILYADATTGLSPIRLSGNENPNINFDKFMLFHAVHKDLSSFDQEICICG